MSILSPKPNNVAVAAKDDFPLDKGRYLIVAKGKDVEIFSLDLEAGERIHKKSDKLKIIGKIKDTNLEEELIAIKL